nr:retrotransposon protein, putative, Ty1-copia subclass [Tanacetum cinerariifolium]
MKACGVVQQLTPPYTPQHNEVFKRRIRTLLDIVRSMMNLINLPLFFWNYDLETATCILNMVSTKKVHNIPYELWYGKVPNLSYLKLEGRELEDIQDEDTSPSENTRKIPMKGEGFKPPQEEVVPVRRYLYGATIDPKHPKKVYKLQRSIYGLKQTSRSWNKIFNEEINRFRFAQNLDEPCVYQKASGINVTFLILYVDNIIIMGNHILSLQSVKSYLEKCFAMKDLGKASFILGIKIYQDRSKRLIGLSQSAYMDKILKRFRMDTSKRVGSIMYVTGYVFILNGGAIDWKSSKSTTVMSAIEAEYIAASEATMKAVWIRKLISRPGIVPTINKPLNMFCDNSAALHFAYEPGVKKGARHYHRRYHYVHECIELGKIELLNVHTDDNLADPFTKALSKGKLTQHARSIGLRLASSFM